MATAERHIATNKKAYHDYFIDETFEAGIELTGTEVKSLRQNKASLRDSFAVVRKGEVFLHNVHISAYSHGNRANVDPTRARKLLLHKKEIRYLATLVPLKLYFNPSNLVKVEIGLARGKKLHDKRASIADRDHKRDVERALRDRQKG
jgi:SsrA-binding protein